MFKLLVQRYFLKLLFVGLRNQIVIDNQKLCYSIFNKLDRYKTLNREDLCQVGMLSLIGATEKFDPERGYTFSTYVHPHVAGGMKHYLRDKGYTLRLPRDMNIDEKNRMVSSLNARIFVNDECEGYEYMDLISDPTPSSDIELLIGTLDPTEQALINMRYVKEQTYKEIGDNLGWKKEKVRRRLNSALEQLRA